MYRLAGKALTIAVCILHSFVPGNAQPSADSSLQNNQFQVPLEAYHRALFPENVLYNGSEYLGYYQSFLDGHPYFLSNRPLAGSIVYEGIFYDQVSLMYDLLKDQLVVIHPVNHYRVKLTNARVSRFVADGHRFVNLPPDSVAKKGISPGFYELLYEGRQVMLIKRMSKVVWEELSSTEGVLSHLKDANSWVVKKGEKYYPISNKQSLLNTFADKRKEMTQFLKKHRIQRKQDNGEIYRLACSYYEELKTSDLTNTNRK